MESKYLITGANGFVGLNLIKKLVKNPDIEIIAVVHDKPNKWLSQIKSTTTKLKVVKCDLNKLQEVDLIIKKERSNHVVHLAAKGLRASHWKNTSDIISSNFLMTLNLLESLKKHQSDLESFINMGSIYEYGNQAGQMREEDEVDYDIYNAYAIAKRVTTILSRGFSDSLPVVNLRLATAYGPFNSVEKFIEGTIYKALRKEDIGVAKGVIKDFIYIEDVVDAIITASNLAKKLQGQTVNIGSGRGRALEQVSDFIIEIVKPQNIENLYKVSEEFQRKQETASWTNIDKAKKLMNWEPKVSLKEGLNHTIGWYKQNSTLL